jgi:hypothetical protein
VNMVRPIDWGYHKEPLYEHLEGRFREFNG